MLTLIKLLVRSITARFHSPVDVLFQVVSFVFVLLQGLSGLLSNPVLATAVAGLATSANSQATIQVRGLPVRGKIYSEGFKIAKRGVNLHTWFVPTVCTDAVVVVR